MLITFVSIYDLVNCGWAIRGTQGSFLPQIMWSRVGHFPSTSRWRPSLQHGSDRKPFWGYPRHLSMKDWAGLSLTRSARGCVSFSWGFCLQNRSTQ